MSRGRPVSPVGAVGLSHADAASDADPSRHGSYHVRPAAEEHIATSSQGTIMQVLVRTDHNIEGHEALSDRITDVVEGGLARVKDRITRVDVHLSDENSDKKGGALDVRCVMEARIEGRPPVAVTDHGATVDQAVSGATHKLTRSVDRLFERLHDRRSRGRGASK